MTTGLFIFKKSISNVQIHCQYTKYREIAKPYYLALAIVKSGFFALLLLNKSFEEVEEEKEIN